MRKNVWLITILITAVFLRLYNLGAGGLVNDEAKTALGVDFPHSFVLPELSVASQKLFGLNEFAVRLPFALIGIAGVILFYYLGKEIYDRNTALIFAGLAALLPGNVIFSRSAFLDVPLVTSWILILIFWVRYEKRPDRLNSAGLLLALFVSPWMKIQAIYLYAALGVYLLIRTRGRLWRDARLWLMGLGFIPFFVYFLSNPQQLYDMYDYMGMDRDITLSGIVDMFRLLWQSYGVLLLTAVVGIALVMRDTIRERKFNKPFILLMLIMTAVTIFALATTPKSFYYYVFFDIPVVFFSTLTAAGISGMKTARYVVPFVIIINLAILLEANNASYPFCPGLAATRDSGRIYDGINRTIAGYPEPRIVYLDSQLGFNGKWYVRHETRKLEQLLAGNIHGAQDKNIVVVLNEHTLTEYGEGLNDFSLIGNYGGVILKGLKL